MKSSFFFLILFAQASLCLNASNLDPQSMLGSLHTASSDTIIGDEYLGQTPPSDIPEVFGPGIVSTEHRDHNLSYTPDMQEFYFTRKDKDSRKWFLIGYKLENGVWREFLREPRLGRPIISPDGNVLHMGDHYKTRTDSGWSKAKSLGPMFDRADWGLMRLSASANGTYVFDDYKSDDLLRISKLEHGKRQAPVVLGPEINNGKYTAHPFIAPDESYLIWDSEKTEGYGESDLYISFRQQDGSWSQSINLGDKINTAATESGAYVSPDGKYLFFNRNPASETTDGDILWVSTEFFDALKQRIVIKTASNLSQIKE
mgnify:CR=1 FL=1